MALTQIDYVITRMPTNVIMVITIIIMNDTAVAATVAPFGFTPLLAIITDTWDCDRHSCNGAPAGHDVLPIPITV